MSEKPNGVLSNMGIRGQGAPSPQAGGEAWAPPSRKGRVLFFHVARTLDDGEAVTNTLDLSPHFDLSR